jgi:hypothetical protein
MEATLQLGNAAGAWLLASGNPGGLAQSEQWKAPPLHDDTPKDESERLPEVTEFVQWIHDRAVRPDEWSTNLMVLSGTEVSWRSSDHYPLWWESLLS